MVSQRPLRVLFVEVAYGALGADYSVHSQLAGALGSSGSLIAQSLSHPDLAALGPDDMERIPCAAYELKGNRLRRKLSIIEDLPGALRRSLPAVKAFDPDVIYSSQLRRDSFAAHLISVATRVPHVVHLHYSYGPWLGRMATRTIRQARHVVAVSEYVRQTALLRGFSEDAVTTVPNLTASRPDVGGGRSAVRAELGIAADDLVVIAVGRLDHGKGFTELIDAVAALDRYHNRLHVLICGESNHSPGHDQALRRIASERGLDSVVHFLGQRPDVPALMAASDVFCLPSKMEPFGLVYLEAMRAGLPVVACRSGGVPEIVVEGVTGMMSYPGDRGQLIANLSTVLDDGGMRARLGDAARERLDLVFDNATISQRWLDVVRNAVSSS